MERNRAEGGRLASVGEAGLYLKEAGFLPAHREAYGDPTLRDRHVFHFQAGITGEVDLGAYPHLGEIRSWFTEAQLPAVARRRDTEDRTALFVFLSISLAKNHAHTSSRFNRRDSGATGRIRTPTQAG